MDLILGASESLVRGDWGWPVHGLRHPPSEGSSGWFVWTGELTGADDFFKPWHASHLIKCCPEVAKLLALPPGSRFLVAPGYEDVWSDPALVNDTGS